MRLIDRINQFVLLFIDTVRQFGMWRAWGLLLGYFLLNWLLLYSHYEFASPIFYGVSTFWMNLLSHLVPGYGPDQIAAFSHYPQHLLFLGDVFGWTKLIVGLIVEGLVLGGVAYLFGQRFVPNPPAGRRSFAATWVNLLIVWLVLNLFTVAAGLLLPQWLEPLLDGPRRVLAFSFVGMPLVFTFIFALFVYALPSVIVNRENAVKAVLRSLKMAVTRPFTSFFLAFAILFIPLFLGTLSGRPADIIDKFRPDLIYWLLVAGLAAEMIANFFWMGTAVRFLSESEER